jgi:hypothetical protein
VRNLALLVGAVTIAVFATSAMTGNAGVDQASRSQAARAVSLQKQVNELRSELICLATAAGDGVAADGYWAAEASGTPKPETSVDDRGVCKQIGVATQGTTPVPNGMAQPFRQIVKRAFGH